MPEAVMYYYKGKSYTVYFSKSNAVLPVKLENGDIQLVKWGKRQNDSCDIPIGGWARLSAIQNKQWDVYFPKPVKLAINKFMKTDFEGHTHWFEVTKGQWIQGLLMQENENYYVYIVVVTPTLLDISFDRWPRIIIG